VSRMTGKNMRLRAAVLNAFVNGHWKGEGSIYPQEDRRLWEAIDMAIELYRFNMNNLNLEGALSAIDCLWREVLKTISRLSVFGFLLL